MTDCLFTSDMRVELVDSMGDDISIARAAWVSTKGERSDEDEAPERISGLINYLMKNRHSSPFEAVVLQFRISAPIFVWREFHRHRTASFNEVSGRYSVLEPKFYVPKTSRPLVQTGKNGQYEFVGGTIEQHKATVHSLVSTSTKAYLHYTALLEQGIAKEVARMVLPVNIYSTCYVTMNARNLMHFLSLRTTNAGSFFPSFPQHEIELVAQQMEERFSKVVPLTHAAFNDYGRSV